MIDLFLAMLERLGIIVTVAFVLTRLHFFQDMIYQDKLSVKKQLMAMLFFGFFGIIGTYFGVILNTTSHQFDSRMLELAHDEAIANSRVIGIVIAGMLGGCRVGIGAGVIAGIHRFTLGGFTAVSCSIATILSGILSGMFYKKGKQLKLWHAFIITALAEALQMLLILAVSQPFEKALVLVNTIGLPMILANGVGAALFLLVIKNVINEEEKAIALQAQKTLRIANQTLAYLRKGLTNESSRVVCEILHKEIKTSAVSITNQTNILAHAGLGSDHHKPNSPLQTEITQKVIQSGELAIAHGKAIHCRMENCPLSAVIVAPLKTGDRIIGTLKFYFQSENEITNIDVELITGLSTLLSSQLAISDADKVYQLAKDAEIKALQAQIRPHFLFNSLNVIVSLIRTEPKKARQLLLSLSKFLRQNLTNTTRETVSLEQELRHVEAYLMIAEARFVDKLKVVYAIDQAVLHAPVPPLTLQPIVENAIKHGIKDMEDNCMVQILIQASGAFVEIKVQDNGKGMTREQIDSIGKKQAESEFGTGMGLFNVDQRLIKIHGKESALKIKSNMHSGTEITFLVPMGGQ